MIKPGSHDVINIIVVAVKTSNTRVQYSRNHRSGDCQHGGNLISGYTWSNLAEYDEHSLLQFRVSTCYCACVSFVS